LWKSLKHKLRIARVFSLPEWLTLAEAWWFLLVSFLTLRRTSFERVYADAQADPSESASASASLHQAQRLSRLVALSSRLHLLPMTCLVRAIALNRMLARRGIRSRLCLGANKSLDRIHAHAWVEVQGQAIGEAEDFDGKFHLLSPSNLPDSPVKQNTLPEKGE